ncbi:VCBS repeat-containing protein [Yinghuangia aomiensis]
MLAGSLSLGWLVQPQVATAADGTNTSAAPSQDKGGGGQGPSIESTSNSMLTATAEQLTRSQVLQRAASWVDKGLVYDGGGTYQGYRRDCSGYVSMAWGLATPGLVTGSFVPSGAAISISKSQLKPGDALNNPGSGSSGHVVIFAGWTNDAQTSYDGYEFSPSGVKHREIPYPYFSGYGTFTPIRAVNVVDDTPTPVRRTSDITGDGRAEIVTQEPDGGIAMGVGDGNGFSNYHRITGNGFADYVNTGRIHFADVTGDGKADIIVQEADGGITMGVGDGNGFSNYHRITGNGFADYLNGGRMHFADITGDGKADMINQEADGGVTLGVGDGNGFSNYHRITTNGFADYLNNGRMHFADITGDGKADIINQEADGGVTLGVGDGNGFSNYHRITTNGFADYLNNGRMHFADITGDGKADIITQEPDGGITMGVGDGNGFSNYHRITTNGFADYLNTPNIQFVG